MEFNIPPLLRAGLFALFASRLPAARPRVAFLDDPLPGADPEIPVLIRQSPVSAGRTVRPLTVAGLAAPRFLTPGRDDILVLTRGDHLSASARENILGFLISGGDLILAGGGEGFLAERFQNRTLVLPAFSRYEPYWLRDTESVANYPDQSILKTPVRINGRFSGFSAVGFIRMSAKFISLLSALDRYGRTRGWAARLMVDFQEYKGSNWLLFGVSNPQLLP